MLVVADAVAIVVATIIAVAAVGGGSPSSDLQASQLWWSSVLALPIWLAVLAQQRLYSTRFIDRRIDEFRRIVNGSILGTGAVVIAAMAFDVLLPRAGVLLLALAATACITVERNLARRVFGRLRARGHMVRPVVIVGANHEARDIGAMLRSEPSLGYELIGFVADDVTTDEPLPGLHVLGGLDDLPSILGQIHRASVIVATSAVPSSTTNRLARDLLEGGVHVELSSSLCDINPSRLTVRPLGRFPVVYLEPRRRSGWRAIAKRAFDIVGASLGLLVAAPLMLVAALAVKLDSAGPVLFRQVRVGKDDRPFNVLKLRSMDVDAEDRLFDLTDLNEADGPLFKMADDPRVTRVGRFLRKTSLDEIPQLWNVLRGDMSLVGPRPALPHESAAWDDELHHRLRVKPGITGMWQVSGRSDASFDDYTRLDLYYVDNWSLATDLAILVRTVPVVAFGHGAR